MKKVIITPLVASGIEIVTSFAIYEYYAHGHRNEDAQRAEIMGAVHDAAFSGFITEQQLQAVVRAAKELGLEI